MCHGMSVCSDAVLVLCRPLLLQFDDLWSDLNPFG